MNSNELLSNARNDGPNESNAYPIGTPAPGTRKPNSIAGRAVVTRFKKMIDKLRAPTPRRADYDTDNIPSTF